MAIEKSNLCSKCGYFAPENRPHTCADEWIVWSDRIEPTTTKAYLFYEAARRVVETKVYAGELVTDRTNRDIDVFASKLSDPDNTIYKVNINIYMEVRGYVTDYEQNVPGDVPGTPKETQEG